MRRVVGLGAAALCFVLLATPADATRTSRRSLTLDLLSTTLANGIVKDLPPKNKRSVGDVFWAHSSLTNRRPQLGRRSGAIAGVDYARFTVLSAHTLLVNVKAVLAGGAIRSKGRVDDRTQSDVIPVVGGTGRYAGARGSLLNRQLDQAVAINVYRLRFP
jgi:hypothetical protein